MLFMALNAGSRAKMVRMTLRCKTSPSVSLNGAETSPGISLTTSQLFALDRLEQLTQLSGAQSYAGFTVRKRALIVGPSGAGKTRVIKTLCDRLRLPLFCCNTGSWIIYGASTTPNTVMACRDFVRRHATGLFFLEELDKSLPSGAGVRMSVWSQGIFGEIVALLDGDQRLAAMGWDDEEIEKLNRHFTIHAAGAWQHLIISARQRQGKALLGFAAQTDQKTESYIDLIRTDETVPQEILFRFHPEPVVISQPSKEDFRAALTEVHRSPRAWPTRRWMNRCCGRWGLAWVCARVEGYVTDLVLRRSELQRRQAKPALAEEEKSRKTPNYVKGCHPRKAGGRVVELRVMLRRLVSREPIFLKALESYPTLRDYFHGEKMDEKSFGNLALMLADSLRPLEARTLYQETLFIMEQLRDVVLEAIDHHCLGLEQCDLLDTLADLAELLDRISQTAHAIHGEEFK